MKHIKKGLDFFFLLTMILYVILGVLIVLGQTVAILCGNGELCLWFLDTLLPPACVVCGITSLISFGMKYFSRWTGKD